MFVYSIGDIIGLTVWGGFLSLILVIWGVDKVKNLIKGKRNDSN